MTLALVAQAALFAITIAAAGGFVEFCAETVNR